MSQKHTPAPWIYDSGSFYAECQLDESGTTSESPIAEMLEGRPEDTKANARLIVEAPCLLKHLEDCIGLLPPAFTVDARACVERVKEEAGNEES